MRPFQYDNKILDFEFITGIVAGANKYTETHVSSYGGGGHIKDGSGYVSAPRIRSTVVTKQEFWLLTETGEERTIKITNFDIPIRDGQKITAIATCGSQENYWVVLLNHNTNQYWTLLSGNELLNRYDIVRGYEPHIVALIISLVVSFPAILLAVAGQYFGIIILAITIIAIIYIIRDYLKVSEERNKVAQLYESHLASIVQEIVNNFTKQQYETSKAAVSDSLSTNLSIIYRYPPIIQKTSKGTKVTIKFDVENKGSIAKIYPYIEFKVMTSKVDGKYTPKIFNSKPTLVEEIPAKSIKTCHYSFYFDSLDIPMVDPPHNVTIDIRKAGVNK